MNLLSVNEAIKNMSSLTLTKAATSTKSTWKIYFYMYVEYIALKLTLSQCSKVQGKQIIHKPDHK